MSELKTAQDALSKAIQRSPINETKKDPVMTVTSPVKLSSEEFEALITEVNDYPVDV